MRTGKYLTLVSCLLLASPVWADGMRFQFVGVTGEIRATEQRAVMWLRDGDWEIHLQPVFDQEQGGAAWVVPFDVRPEVHEGNADFLDELEILTAPVFLKVCENTHSACTGCIFGSSAGDMSGTPEEGDAHVKVWERGEVGDLDYVILSASEGDDLAAWLQDEGYQTPDGFEALLADFETEGVFFFVARLSAGSDPDKPSAPVRFVLPDLQTPSYPLRLTRLGVNGDDTLGLTLWVIFPGRAGDTAYLPDGRPIHTSLGNPKSPEEFDSGLNALFSQSPGGLVALFGAVIHGTREENHLVCDESGRACAPFDWVGIEAPEEWSEEINQILSNEIWISRYEARLSARHMEDDLTLRADSPIALPHLGRVYTEWTCEPHHAAMGCLVLLTLGAGIRRLRRQKRKGA